MSDRTNTITVVLEQTMRIDDTERIISSIEMIKGVLCVSADIANISDYMAEERARRELGKKILEIIYPTPFFDGEVTK